MISVFIDRILSWFVDQILWTLHRTVVRLFWEVFLGRWTRVLLSAPWYRSRGSLPSRKRSRHCHRPPGTTCPRSSHWMAFLQLVWQRLTLLSPNYLASSTVLEDILPCIPKGTPNTVRTHARIRTTWSAACCPSWRCWPCVSLARRMPCCQRRSPDGRGR